MKKKIVYATMLMSTIALLSTGFAAWIINIGDSEQYDGSIAVDTVSNVSRIIGDFAWEGYNPEGSHTRLSSGTKAYSYSSPRFDESGNPVICYGGSVDGAGVSGDDFYNDHLNDAYGNNFYENLIVSATFTVTNVPNKETLDLSVFDSIEFSLSDTSGTAFANAVTNGYISGLPKFDKESNKFNNSDIESGSYGVKLEKIESAEEISDENSKYKITIKFGWGEAFSYKNPYDYYNDNKGNEGFSADTLLTNLSGMENALDKVSYNLTIKTAKQA